MDLRGYHGNIIGCDPSCHLNISIFVAQEPHLLKVAMGMAPSVFLLPAGPVGDFHK